MTTLVLLAIAYVAGVISAGVWHRQRDQEAGEAAGELDRDIVRDAMQHGGRITALDVRSRSAPGLEVVEQRLRALHSSGYCESDLDEEGRPIYVFPAFDEAPMRAVKIEKQVLQLARRGEGIVRVSSVTVESDLSYAEARQLLERMQEDGMCEATDDADTFRFFPLRTGHGHAVAE